MMPKNRKSKGKPPIRKTWPRIRLFKDQHGQTFYQVDARRKGTSGKRESFLTKKEAEDRAAEIKRDFDSQGTEGLALEAEVRVMAVRAKIRLEPYGKTIADAVAFYEAHLKREKAKAESATVTNLSDLWLKAKSKKTGNKILRKDTIKDITDTSNILDREFGSKRLLEITEKDMQDYLDDLPLSQRTKHNRRNRFCQFFNWCIKQGHTSDNPLKNIKIDVPTKEVQILSVEESDALMKKCESTFPDLVPYFAISLFAGLRPNECKLLQWSEVHLEEKQITVWGHTSKTGETRNVKIEPTLAHWLSNYTGNKKGFVVHQKSYRTQMEKIRASLGYKVGGKNPEGPKWHEDICRHTYASYWIQTYKDRAHLAEQMGNSLKMIKQHYKRIVKSSDAEKFWAILPTGVIEAEKLKASIIDVVLSKI